MYQKKLPKNLQGVLWSTEPCLHFLSDRKTRLGRSLFWTGSLKKLFISPSSHDRNLNRCGCYDNSPDCWRCYHTLDLVNTFRIETILVGPTDYTTGTAIIGILHDINTLAVAEHLATVAQAWGTHTGAPTRTDISARPAVIRIAQYHDTLSVAHHLPGRTGCRGWTLVEDAKLQEIGFG